MIDAILLLSVAAPQGADPANVVAAVAAGVAAQMAQDAAARAANMALSTLVVQTVGTIVLAWIALKQAKLDKNVHLIEKHGNSMREELVKATAKMSRAEGNLEGRSEQKQEAEQASQPEIKMIPQSRGE